MRQQYLRLLAAVVIALSPLLVPLHPAGAAAEDASTKGFSEIAGCISGAENVLVSIVVDESLSLRSTDPNALRVQGITTAVDSLEQLTESVGRSTRVEVSLATFARSFETLLGWRKLNGRTAEQFRAEAEQTLPGRDAGNATDYRQALLGAKRLLDERQRAIGDPNACKLLLWFTDGALDVDAETGTAFRELCQVGGIADAVRDDGIAVLALALFTPGAGVTQQQRDQLRAVAEGKGGGTSCGTNPIPADSASGVYLPADDPAALQRLFAGAGALVAGGTEAGSVSCPGPECAGGTYRLNLDPGIAGARVLVQSSTAPDVTVTSPRGKSVELSSGRSTKIEGARISYLLRDRLATLNFALDPYAETQSRWLIEPKGPSELSVYWFWGASLAVETSKLQAGDKNEIRLQLLDQAEQPLPARLFRAPQASLRVGDRTLKAQLSKDGSLRATVALGVDDVPSALPITATLEMRSAPGGVPLGPISVTERLPVELPPSYPTVAPSELDFGALEGVGTTTAELHLSGSKLGDTEVCFAGSDVTVPGDPARMDLVETDNECVALAANETGRMQVELSPVTTADGLATGEVTLRLSAADGSDDIDLTVPVRLEMERRVDEATRWALIAALLALALLIPALLLVGSNLLLGRFAMSSLSRTTIKSVKVTPTGLEPVGGGGRLLEPEDFSNASFSGVRKGGHMTIDGSGIDLRARRIFSLKEPEGVATGPAGRLLVSSTMPYRHDRLNEAPVALGEVDATFVVVDATGATADEAPATLVMSVPADVDRQGIHDRASRMSSVPDWRKVLAEASQTSKQGTDRSDPGTMTPVGEVDDSSGSSESDSEAPPPMPWDTPSGAGGAQTPPPTKQPRSKKLRKPRSAPPAEQPGSDPDDTLPPLPDFLK